MAEGAGKAEGPDKACGRLAVVRPGAGQPGASPRPARAEVSVHPGAQRRGKDTWAHRLEKGDECIYSQNLQKTYKKS